MPESPLLVEGDLDAFREGDVNVNLEAAVAAIRGYCRWHIAPVRTETLTLDANGSTVILPTLYATAVVLEVDGTTIDEADYTLHPGYLQLRGCWTNGTVTVTLTHGYEELPADLRRVALSMADEGTSPGGRLKSAGPFVYELSESADTEVLDRYRLAPRP
jgi:hypothetical protein